MKLQWTSKALADLVRVHEFLAVLNKPAATRMLKSLLAAPAGLVANPRIGEKLDEFQPKEVRRILVGHYEMRYEIAGSTLYILRVWHTREKR
jgi:plasmid stabilization system protein ParE